MKKFIKNKIIKVSKNFKMNKCDIASIYYHDVKEKEGNSFDTISLENFIVQMNEIKRLGYEALTFNDLKNMDDLYQKNKKYIVITFDDGYRSNYNLVFPLLKKMGIKFNIFLEVKKIDKDNEFLTWEMVKEMNDSECVGFGSHTYNHVDMRFNTVKRLEKEIFQSNQEIFNNTKIIIKDFCYPFGAYSNQSNNILNDTDEFERIFTSDGVYINELSKAKVIGRVGIENEDSLQTFNEKLVGDYNFYFKYMRRIKMILGVNNNEIRRI